MTGQRVELNVTVNGKPFTVSVESRVTLADVLRDRLGLTGTHVGCEQGSCGACTVLLNGEAVRSCLVLAVQASGALVETVESLAADGTFSSLQSAFADHHALQCGYCTPGILMSLTELARASEPPSERVVKDVLAGHLCRCTGYQPILAAALSVLCPADRSRDNDECV